MTGHITDSKFWNHILDGVYGPRKGGAKILVDAKDASLGAGKTSCAVYLARLFAEAFDYELQEEDFVLSGKDYLERYREHPGRSQPSVIVLDEMVGAGAGDKMRTTSTKNVNLMRAWQLQRTKRVITISTLASWSDAVKGLRKLADYRILCLPKPIGTFIPYKLGTFDFDESSKIKFERLNGRTSFPKMDGDPLFEAVSEKKDELIQSDAYDADALREDGEANKPEPEEVERETLKKTAQALRNAGVSGQEFERMLETNNDEYEDISRSASWFYNNTTEPDSGDNDQPNRKEATA